VHCSKYDLSHPQLADDGTKLDSAEVKCWSTEKDATYALSLEATQKPPTYIQEITNPLGSDLEFHDIFDSLKSWALSQEREDGHGDE